MKKLLLTLLVVIIVVVGAWWLMGREAKAPSETSTPTITASVKASPTVSAKPTVTPQSNITISSPKAGAVVSSPITITGKARIFENQFSVAVTTLDGHVIVKKEAVMSDAKESGQFGNYSVTLDIPNSAPADIKVISYAYSPKGDGTYEGYAEVIVKLKGLLIQY